MKDVDGIAATRQLTTADSAAKIIIVISYDETDLREEARARPATCGDVRKENIPDVRRLLPTRG